MSAFSLVNTRRQQILRSSPAVPNQSPSDQRVKFGLSGDCDRSVSDCFVTPDWLFFRWPCVLDSITLQFEFESLQFEFSVQRASDHIYLISCLASNVLPQTYLATKHFALWVDREGFPSLLVAQHRTPDTRRLYFEVRSMPRRRHCLQLNNTNPNSYPSTLATGKIRPGAASYSASQDYHYLDKFFAEIPKATCAMFPDSLSIGSYYDVFTRRERKWKHGIIIGADKHTVCILLQDALHPFLWLSRTSPFIQIQGTKLAPPDDLETILQVVACPAFGDCLLDGDNCDISLRQASEFSYQRPYWASGFIVNSNAHADHLVQIQLHSFANPELYLSPETVSQLVQRNDDSLRPCCTFISNDNFPDIARSNEAFGRSLKCDDRCDFQLGTDHWVIGHVIAIGEGNIYLEDCFQIVHEIDIRSKHLQPLATHTKSGMKRKYDHAQSMNEAGEGTECIICLTEPKRRACIPCGHVVFCDNCHNNKNNNSNEICSTCPICFAVVQQIICIYM